MCSLLLDLQLSNENCYFIVYSYDFYILLSMFGVELHITTDGAVILEHPVNIDYGLAF